MSNGPTPTPEKVATAEQLATLKTDVAWIKKAIQENHICTSMPQIKSLLDWRKAMGAGLVALATILAAVVVLLVTTCNAQNERDTTTQAVVEGHSRDIKALKTSISEVNAARAADAERISAAVDKLRTAPRDGGVVAFCAGLSAKQRRSLRRTLANDYPCRR